MSVTFYVDGDIENDPYLNVANGNAQTVLQLMGLDGRDPYVGEIQPNDLPLILRRLMKFRNNRHELFPFIKEPLVESNIIEFGRSMDQILRYTEQMSKLCSFAMQINRKVIWQ